MRFAALVMLCLVESRSHLSSGWLYAASRYRKLSSYAEAELVSAAAAALSVLYIKNDSTDL